MKVAAIQTRAGSSLDQVFALVDRADARLVVLPEVFAVVPEALDRMRETARRRKIWLAGSLLLQEDAPLPYNTCVLAGPDGEIRAKYRKIHLFDVPGIAVESKVMSPGRDTVTVEVDGFKAGFAICFDLRFPDLFARQDADLFLVPSAFSLANGPAHWELLVRARAVERQAYVVAPNQEGTLATGMETWGHSMIIDPWGTVLAEAMAEGVVTAEISLDRIAEFRRRLPLENGSIVMKTLS